MVSSEATEQRRQYYERLFPFKHVYRWLNHSLAPQTDFTNRELAFSLDRDGQEIYVRYKAFTSPDGFRKEVVAENPLRFEIGPVYTANPRDRRALPKSVFRPVAKELVFDIDLTDYDDIRTCCQDKDICEKCWNFITTAIHIMDTALRNDFGFKHLLWVYSGRRGAHCWVSDKRARVMDDAQRRAVVGYLTVVGKGERGKDLVNVQKRPLHPHVARSLEDLKQAFLTVLAEQDPWASAKGSEKLAELFASRNKELAAQLKQEWAKSDDSSSMDRWSSIDKVVKSLGSKANAKMVVYDRQDILLQYTYPRLDTEVSKHLNHLLKSPFCVHPATGRVCVPIDAQHPEEFSPLNVPTVEQLLQEIDDYDQVHKGDEDLDKVSAYDKTSLKPYMELFKKYVAELLEDEEKIKRPRQDLEF